MRRFIFRRFAKWAIVAVASVFVFACGESPTAVVKPPPVDTTPKVTSIVVSGDATLIVGAVKQYLCRVYYDRGDPKDCPPSTSWGSLPSTVVSVNAGIATALRPGNVQITATFEGVSSTLSVEVKPDPVVEVWNKLSSEVQRMVQFFKASDGVLWEVNIRKSPKLWVNPQFPSDSVAQALQNVSWRTGVVNPFTLVSDSTQAPFKIVYDSALIAYRNADGTEICGNTSGKMAGGDHEIVSGRISIRPDMPSCSQVLVLEHELTHIIGSGGHAPDGTDVMSSSGVKAYNPDQTAALRFVFTVAPLAWRPPAL